MLLTMMATTAMWGQTRTETTTTYTFTSKSWAATIGGSAANWTSGQDGSGFSNNGIQVTTSSTGANGTSPVSFTNITKIVATYNTNKSKGAGTIVAKIGSNDGVTKNWAYSTGNGTQAFYTVQWDYTTPQSGNVKITCNTTTNSIYLVSVAITTDDGTSPSISAANVDIAYDAEGGSIAYTLNNATGNVNASITTGDWLTLGTVTSSAVPFTCSANEGAQRTATVTLSFTGATDKVVTVTQAAAPLTTIPAIFAKATEVGSTQTDVNVTFNNWKVVGKSYSNAYVSDGQYGLNLYKSGGIDFAIGDQLSGTVATKVQLFTGGAELVGLSTSTTGLTVTHNQTFEPYAISLADVFGEGIYYGSYVDLGNLTYSNGNFTDGNNVITPYNTFNIQNYPTLEAGKTYRVKGVYIQYNNTTKRIAPVYASDFTEFSGPNITLTPAAANPFTYVENQGPSAQQDFTVALENETSKNVTATITTGTDYFEIKNGENWASATTINIDNTNPISVRMKAGLALGNNYAGVMTLTNEDATDVVVNLSGSVTGSTYTIEQYSLPATAHGTITFAPAATVEAGTEVTLTATPDAGYDFTANSWVFYKQSGEDIVVDESIVATNNVITMPAYDIWVDATFTAKPTYAITCVASPVAGGIIEASPASAYQGQTVTLSYVPETGYNLVKIKITKTSDGSITGITPVASGDDFTFTMPAYAVTATATFVPNTYAGNFVKFTGDIAEGDYILTYDEGAMNNTISSSRFGIEDLNDPGNIITNPSTDIVWHIAPSVTDGYWTVYNAKKDQYANGAANGTTVSLVDNPTYSGGAKWGVTKNNNEYRLRCKDNEDYTARYLGRNDNYGFANYGSTYGVNLTLYKYTELTESTITFNGNGGTTNTSATSYTQNVYNGVATALTANQFTKANSLFAGWALTADGDVEYADQAEVTVNADLNLYAKWNVSNTAMADDQIVGGTVLINGEEIVEAAEGTEMTLTYTANVGYAFSEWNVYKADDETTKVTVTENTFTMPAYDVIVSATFGEVTTYSLITNVSQIVSGKHYIIASGTNGSVRVMAEQKDNNRTSVAATATTGVISETEGIYEFVINGPETITVNDEQVSVYTIYDASYPGFLYAASSSSNYLRTRGTNTNGNSQWTVAVTAEGVATIKSQGNFTRNWMRNNGNIFACYESSQADIYLFVKNNDNDLEFYGNNTCDDLTIAATETITITAGSTLTVTGDLTNNGTAANLVVQEGGQLIHTSPVEATIQKGISGYSKSSLGWYLIASPVDGLSTSAVATGTYDLFVYNEPYAYWYSNTGTTAPFTTLSRGTGYLYANTADQTLNFAGEMEATDATIQKDLSYACEDTDLKGFNLMGNPFSRNLVYEDITIGGTAITQYYALNAAQTEFEAVNIEGYGVGGKAIKPGQGFFIQAIDENHKLVFNPSSKDETENRGYISIVAGNENTSDNAYINVGNGNTLRKMNIANSTKVYVMNHDKDYAAARIETANGSRPVHFEAVEDGYYTITVEANNLDLEIFRLIDNFSGEETDLLVEPSYTFKASIDDDAARFTLVFQETSINGIDENNVENDIFAYQNGSDIIVNGDGTLQVFDVMGRLVMTTNVNGIETINVKSQGVYIFRLNGMTQKIVVR